MQKMTKDRQNKAHEVVEPEQQLLCGKILPGGDNFMKQCIISKVPENKRQPIYDFFSGKYELKVPSPADLASSNFRASSRCSTPARKLSDTSRYIVTSRNSSPCPTLMRSNDFNMHSPFSSSRASPGPSLPCPTLMRSDMALQSVVPPRVDSRTSEQRPSPMGGSAYLRYRSDSGDVEDGQESVGMATTSSNVTSPVDNQQRSSIPLSSLMKLAVFCNEKNFSYKFDNHDVILTHDITHKELRWPITRINFDL
ncbi:unnamed protein product [Bursaphelenchus okinawaensis]|uniref:Uncharacterized protein n=1 Tax=Bursaphelenchus okinawaensis TaxID=465554 RepID=A0A811KS66_9BILA|nr:unnamed protein product [Bursaphelenchus okinawaensis]CAG9111145.1 unnamed protein product [Bursaphelenchus okinawaensis]